MPSLPTKYLPITPITNQTDKKMTRRKSETKIQPKDSFTVARNPSSFGTDVSPKASLSYSSSLMMLLSSPFRRPRLLSASNSPMMPLNSASFFETLLRALLGALSLLAESALSNSWRRSSNCPSPPPFFRLSPDPDEASSCASKSSNCSSFLALRAKTALAWRHRRPDAPRLLRRLTAPTVANATPTEAKQETNHGDEWLWPACPDSNCP
mmetsp:Transcript_21166/g.38641  ORF Transcript_21166/g.38641 Transcript_21166/m.38641 type:complete len:210 (+) Transcript_21166:198-827(+)